MPDDTDEWIDSVLGPYRPPEENSMPEPVPTPVPAPVVPPPLPDIWVQRIEAIKGLIVAVLPYLVAIGGGAGWWHSAIQNGGKLESVTSELKSVTAKVDESARMMARPPLMVGQAPPKQ